MRGLLVFVCLVVFVDTAFFAAITPILPELSDQYDLSKTAAGILAATYPAGTLIGALPGGWLAARAGTRPTVLIGLGLLVGSSIVFAFADSIVVLDVARFVQGIGGAASWAGALGWLIGAAPRERRGSSSAPRSPPRSWASSSARAGSGRRCDRPRAGVRLGRGDGGGDDGVGAAAAAGRGGGDSRLRTLLGALADRRVAVGMWLTALPGLLFGTLSVLGPLRLDELGAGATAIGAVWLTGAALEAFINPIVGRFSDRRGRLIPSMVGVASGALVMLALPWPSSAWVLGGLIVVAAPLIGTLWTPAMAMLSDGAEAFGVDQGFAFALVNLAWATGQTTGAAGSARLADAAGDHVPYLVLAGVCALTLGMILRLRERVAV